MDHYENIVIYRTIDGTTSLDVKLDHDTVWLNRQQIATLFDRDVKTIGKHINNALQEELKDYSVVAKFATTAADGKTYQVEYYNLDMIISVGYRVKSRRGTQFRIWANQVLKDYLLKGYAIHQRMEHVERLAVDTAQRLTETERKIDFFVKTSLPPVEGVFFNGQIFDAYTFVADLIRSAKQAIVLIDNYVDDSVLLLLSKREVGVKASIYTARISVALQQDLDKHNTQYPPISVTKFENAHDRFLIIDDTVYHFGASLKDLGKKWFAFSKMEMSAQFLLTKL